MAASDEWTEWHLTPRGWERGTEKEDFKGIDRKEPPADRVMTTKYRQHMGSSFSPVKETNQKEWTGPDCNLIKTLLDSFGPPPNHL